MMLNLPKSTELNKVLAKADIHKKFALSSKDKELFDNDISRLYISHEISPRTLAIEKSDDISAIFILSIQLKNKDFDEKNIALLAKLIPQKMLFMLEFEHEVKFAVCLPYVQNKVLQTKWLKGIDDNFVLDLSVDTLNKLWDKIIIDISNIKLSNENNTSNTIEEAIINSIEQEKILKKIEQLEKKARNEKQPKKKFEILEEVKRLKEKS